MAFKSFQNYLELVHNHVTRANNSKKEKGKKRPINLVSGHAVLFHLLELALQFVLALSLLLCTAHIHLPAVQLFAIHVIHRLQKQNQEFKLFNALEA